MKNKKGFTIVELGVSIALVTVVSFLLFQMITTIKKVYNSGDLKTTMLTKQAIMTKKIYDEFDEKTISQISNCDDGQLACLKFIFSDNSTSMLLVDPLTNTISYNNYTVDYDEIDDTTMFGELVFNIEDDFFTIKIPITSRTIKGDYGIFVTKQYTNYLINSYIDVRNNIVIPISNDKGDIVTTTITNDGSDYWMRVYDAVGNPTLDTFITPYFKHLNLETCSDESFTGTIYELKTGTNSSRWCQTNNLYTQNVGEYRHISGAVNTSIGKQTYKEILTTTSILNSTTLDVKVNSFVERYTFKSR